MEQIGTSLKNIDLRNYPSDKQRLIVEIEDKMLALVQPQHGPPRPLYRLDSAIGIDLVDLIFREYTSEASIKCSIARLETERQSWYTGQACTGERFQR